LFKLKTHTMRAKTILNFVDPQPRFVYGHTWLQRAGRGAGLYVRLRPKKGCKPRCSGCGKPRPGYDKLPERTYRYLPMLATLAVFFVYQPRRCECLRCGVTVEQVPWAEGKSPITHALSWYLASWAKVLPWQEVARRFHVCWDVVFQAVGTAVKWGLKNQSFEGITAIGVDELSRKKGQVYFTMVYQIDKGCRRLLWLGPDRTAATFNRFFNDLGENVAGLRFITSDMWKAFLSVAAKRAPRALHVLDRFHVAKLAGEAVDEVRRNEAQNLRKLGKGDVLKHARWLLLKNKANLNADQGARLADLLKLNLRTVKAYVLKDMLDLFWDKKSRAAGGRFLDNWCHSASRSRLAPFKRFAATLRVHKPLLLNWFKADNAFAKGATEGLNNKARVVTRRSYGFRNRRVQEIALFHALGKLPEPAWVTHRFS